ncbi:hypothetical protein Tco_1274064 [Tanacetum coccineum]
MYRDGGSGGSGGDGNADSNASIESLSRMLSECMDLGGHHRSMGCNRKTGGDGDGVVMAKSFKPLPLGGKGYGKSRAVGRKTRSHQQDSQPDHPLSHHLYSSDPPPEIDLSNTIWVDLSYSGLNQHGVGSQVHVPVRNIGSRSSVLRRPGPGLLMSVDPLGLISLNHGYRGSAGRVLVVDSSVL